VLRKGLPESVLLARVQCSAVEGEAVGPSAARFQLIREDRDHLVGRR
jgi:hypothetical protein